MAARDGNGGSKRTIRWRQPFARLCRQSDGSVAVIFALAGSTLIGLVGGAIDYVRFASARTNLQSAVDAGVLAGGNALKLVVSSSESIVGLTTQTIQAEARAGADAPVSIQVTVAPDKTSVEARAQQVIKLTFGGFVGMASIPIAARARASVVGRMRLCMLALDPAAAGAFNLERNAQVTAYDCALYSNSISRSGMVGRDGALARAQTICSAGGFKDDRANFTPNPQTSCPVIEDPLRNRPAPPVGSCVNFPETLRLADLLTGKSKGSNVIAESLTLDPGTYCGGLHITKNAVVTLRPGIYVMKDGPLIVDKNATMTGKDVGFYFVGNNSGLLFDKKTTVDLSAPTTGAMAGLLMAEDPSVTLSIDPVQAVDMLLGDIIRPTPPPLGTSKPMRTYRIISDNTRTMLGTIYLPAGRLVIDSQRPVADLSAYTVVVAQQINLYEGPNLYLNADYNRSSVPIPKGVGPISGRLVISQ